MARDSITLHGEKKMFDEEFCRASSRNNLKAKLISGGELESSGIAAPSSLPAKGHRIPSTPATMRLRSPQPALRKEEKTYRAAVCSA
jgi:hypothetical protein